MSQGGKGLEKKPICFITVPQWIKSTLLPLNITGPVLSEGLFICTNLLKMSYTTYLSILIYD